MTNSTATRSARVTRGVEHARSYGPLLRLADRLAGLRDRRAQTQPTPLVAKLQATFDENDRRILAHAQDVSQQSVRRLRELTADVRRIDALIAAAQAALDGVEEPGAAQLSTRNGGELHLEDFAVTTRRRREHLGHVASLDATLKRHEGDRDARLVEGAHHAARLVEEFELARTVSERLRHFYDRRLANYARAARINGTATPHISAPVWTAGGCPWLPEAECATPSTAHGRDTAASRTA